MATIHNEAEPEQIAPVVLMPGDPLRAKLIAEEYLENCILFNQVRNMLGYTGWYKGHRISVMGAWAAPQLVSMPMNFFVNTT